MFSHNFSYFFKKFLNTTIHYEHGFSLYDGVFLAQHSIFFANFYSNSLVPLGSCGFFVEYFAPVPVMRNFFYGRNGY